jgi:hypothetical protein
MGWTHFRKIPELFSKLRATKSQTEPGPIFQRFPALDQAVIVKVYVTEGYITQIVLQKMRIIENQSI